MKEYTLNMERSHNSRLYVRAIAPANVNRSHNSTYKIHQKANHQCKINKHPTMNQCGESRRLQSRERLPPIQGQGGRVSQNFAEPMLNEEITQTHSNVESKFADLSKEVNLNDL